MTLNNKKCECSVKNISHMPYCPLTTKNSEWEERQEQDWVDSLTANWELFSADKGKLAILILQVEVNARERSKVDLAQLISEHRAEAYEEGRQAGRSQDTVGELIKEIEKTIPKATERHVIEASTDGVEYTIESYEEKQGWNCCRTKVLSALQKLSEQIEQK